VYIASVVNSNYSSLNISLIYSNVVAAEAIKSAWSFYLTLVPKDLGLYNSNFHKSVVLKLISSSSGVYTPYQLPQPKYIDSFKSYHFNTLSQVYKKLLFTCIAKSTLSYQPYNLTVSMPSGYL
jgi:hypothetical protein